jgi:hypothetical protein
MRSRFSEENLKLEELKLPTQVSRIDIFIQACLSWYLFSYFITSSLMYLSHSALEYNYLDCHKNSTCLVVGRLGSWIRW